MPELKEVLAKAMANAPRVVDAGLSADYYDANVKAARAPMLPNVGANVNFGEIKENYQYSASQITDETGVVRIKPSHTTERTTTLLTYNAGVTQPLYRWGALKKGYESAQLQRAIANRNVEEARRILAIEVRRAYFDLIITSNTRDYQRLTLINLEQDHEAMKLRQEDGFVTGSEVSVAASKVAAQKTAMERTDQQFESQWRALRQLAGLDPAAIWDLPKEVAPVPKDFGVQIDALSAEMGARLPNSVLNAEDLYRAERLNYEVQKVRQRPQLNMSLSVSQENRAPSGDPSQEKALLTTYGAYLNVSWNIFDGFATQAAKQAALVQARRRKNDRDQAEYTAREALRTYVNNLRMDWKALEAAELSLTALRDGLVTYQKDFESGFVQRSVWDTAKLAVDYALISTNSMRASFHLQLLNYIALRGQDPALVPSATK